MEHGAVVERFAGFRAVGEAHEILDRLGRLIGEELYLEVPSVVSKAA